MIVFPLLRQKKPWFPIAIRRRMGHILGLSRAEIPGSPGRTASIPSVVENGQWTLQKCGKKQY
jgi:hypothetical protein